MRESCVMIPAVRTTSNEVKESKLFKDLLSFTNQNRSQAVDLYVFIKSQDFTTKYEEIVKTDDNGEPLLSSIIDNVTIKNVLDDAIISNNLSKKLNDKDKDGNIKPMQDTTNNYIELSKRVIEFNRTSPFKNNYVAIIAKADNGSIVGKVEKLDDTNSILAKKITSSYYLNNKIRTILSNYGITPEIVDTLQNELSASGVVDYSNAEVTASGLINVIKLAQGSAGEMSLPEEFSHFMLDVMSDNTMVQRLVELSSREDIQKVYLGEDYESYFEDYNGDINRLARETAGKIVTRYLVNNESMPQQYAGFFTRVFNAITNFFKNIFSADEIARAINESETLAGEIANRIIVEDDAKEISLEKLKKLSNLKHLEAASSNAYNIISESINNVTKEFSVYSKKLEYQIKKAETPQEKSELENKLASYETNIRKYLGDQSIFLAKKQYNLGVERFIEFGAKELEGVKTKLTQIINNPVSNQSRAQMLQNCKNIIDSNKSVLNMVQESILDSESDLELSEDCKNRLNVFASDLSTAEQSLYAQSILTFTEFIEKYLPKEGITITSNGTSKKITREDLNGLLKTAEKDLSLLNTWVQSMAESGDIIMALADQAMKNSKETKRLRVLEVKKQLLALGKKLKAAGIEDTDWMFEKHKNGTLGTNYISDINWTAYNDAVKKLSASNPSPEYRKVWYSNNWDYTSNTPNKDIYGVDIDDLLPQGSVKREYYDYFMELRKELISYLPDSLYKNNPTKAIQITKDLWERIKSTSPDTWASQIWKETKNQLVTKADDTQFGAKADFKGEELLSVPIFFVNNVTEESELSRDTVSTMMAFADMAINYDEMNQVADYFELGGLVIDNRKAKVLRGNKPIKEFIDRLDSKVSQEITKGSQNFISRYNEFLRSQLYGRYMRDGVLLEGENYEIKANKAASLLNKFSSLNQLALNGLAGIAAVGNDMLNINSEALAGQYFTAKNLKDADAIYLKELAGVLGEAGDPVKTNKLSLFIEKFDVLHEYDDDIRDLEWDKSKIKKLLSSNSLYIFMHMGSHWGETRTALAQAKKIKIKSDDGTKEESLWDTLTTEWIDSADHTKGAKLVTKEGYTLTNQDIIKYTRKFMGLNERLFGIYNQADRNALQSTAIGQLVFLYRKFMVPAINRRFGSANYNLDLQETTEGYYRSFYHFIANTITDSRNLGRNIKMYWNDMSDNEKSNCIRAVNELASFTALAVIAAVCSSAGWDKKDNPWHKRFIAYMSKRMRTEAGAFTPFGVFGELENIIKSPAAAINTLDGIGDILGAINPWNYEAIGGEDAIVKSGRYKGHNKAYKRFMNSPFLPMNKTIYKMLHPEESIVAFN